MVVTFNDRINARDLASRTALMTEDHTFEDPAGAVVRGRAACTGAWQGFFAAFPDYRNVFVAVVADGDTVTVTGHSTCSEPALAGPAVPDRFTAATLAKCDPFGTPLTSHWTGAAIIEQSLPTKTCTVTRSRTSNRPMPFSLAG